MSYSYTKGGRFTAVIGAVRTLIAGSAQFQTITGSEDAAEAAALVYYGGLPVAPTIPCAMIHDIDNVDFIRIAMDISRPKGTVLVTFFGAGDGTKVDADGEVDDFEAAIGGTLDWVAKVADEIEAAGRAAGCPIMVTGIAFDDGGTIVDDIRRVQAESGSRNIDTTQSIRLSIGPEPPQEGV